MHAAKRFVWAALDRVTVFLPIVLMAVLALGTWWLARNTPVLGIGEADKPVQHEPDYFMRDFSVKTYDDKGALKSDVRGAQGRHFADTDVLEIDGARIHTLNSQGRMTTATAHRAISNGDGSEVQLVGNALVVREAGADSSGKAIPRLEFRGEFLHAFVNTEQVKSHKPVEITRGADRFSADAMSYDNLERVAQLTGRVRGVLQPAIKP